MVCRRESWVSTATYCNTQHCAATHLNTIEHTLVLTGAQLQSFRDCGTGWRRLIASPKLQIIFLIRATKYRLLLRKMTCKDKGSYESSPPCISLKDICKNCNILQHTALRCNTLQHTLWTGAQVKVFRDCGMSLQDTCQHCNILQHAALTHFRTLF